MEEKCHVFEEAIFQTQQRADEFNDSYLARHEARFEDLLTHGVSIEEIRADILLRLSPDDKKKVIMVAKATSSTRRRSEPFGSWARCSSMSSRTAVPEATSDAREERGLRHPHGS